MAELSEVPIAPPPGVIKTSSQRVIEGRWSDTINMRFVSNQPQKIQGWTKLFQTPTDGTPRSLHAWRDLKFNAFMGVGTYRKVYIYDQNEVQNDITPIRSEGTLGTDPISTTSGSNVIEVEDTAHGLSVGDLIYLSGISSVGGITPNVSGVPVNSVIDADNYTYLFTSNASSTATGGGSSVDYQYEVPVGVELGTYGYGYGVGGYGLGTYGDPREESTVIVEPRIWSLDHFGVFLLASYNGGSIYSFDPTDPQPWGRAELISADPGLPTNVRAMFITPERFVMALCDGMQVKWPSQGTLDDWTPTALNTANIRTLTEGTKLVGGKVLTDFVSLIWTDAALYKFQYTGATYIYSSSLVARDCGLLSPNAAVTVGGIGYWIGQTTLWTYNGTVTPMPNVDDIRKWIFDRLDINLGYQCNASFSPSYNEIWFFFSLVGETNPTIGLIYSIENQRYAPLYWGRTGGTHHTQGDTRAVFGGSDFFLYQHENTNDADGEILEYSMTLAPYALTKGGRRGMDVEYIVPDFFEQVGEITLTMTGWDYLNDSLPMDTDTAQIAAVDSGAIDMRVTGRYVGVMWSCAELGSYVRLGLPVAFVKPTGVR